MPNVDPHKGSETRSDSVLGDLILRECYKNRADHLQRIKPDMFDPIIDPHTIFRIGCALHRKKLLKSPPRSHADYYNFSIEKGSNMAKGSIGKTN